MQAEICCYCQGWHPLHVGAMIGGCAKRDTACERYDTCPQFDLRAELKRKPVYDDFITAILNGKVTYEEEKERKDDSV